MVHSRGGYTPLLEFVKTVIRKDKGGKDAESEKYRAEIHGSPKKRKLLLIISAAIAAILVIVAVSVAMLVMLAIAYM